MPTSKASIDYPDPLAPHSEKITDQYALKVAKAISSDWFSGADITRDCDYGDRRDWIYKMRLEARGKDSVDAEKDHVSREKEQLDFMNMDWRNLNYAGKFINIVVNGIKEEFYQVDISAIDQLSNQIREKYRRRLQEEMYASKMLKRATEVLNIDMTSNGFIPGDEEELDIHMEIDYAPITEISEELLIDYVKLTNNWGNIKQKVNYDLAECGLGVVKCYTDKTDGVKLKYVNIENFIHSYVNMNDFSDCHYFGEVDTITISELQRISGFSEDVLREIAEMSGKTLPHTSTTIRNYQEDPFENLLDIKVNILNFTFKSTKEVIYKKTKSKHNTIKMNRKGEDFNPAKRSDYERVDNRYDTWYEGSYVIGSDHIYNYRESENIVEDELNRAASCYIVRATDIYRNELHSFMEDISPIKAQIQRVHLKIQQMVAEMRPDPIELDLDMLADLDSGEKGKASDWKMALGLFQAKGIYFSSRLNLGEDGMKDRPAMRPAPVNQASQLPALLNAWAHYYNLMREITGINPFRDGTQPSDALVGVQQMAVMASNTATEYIVRASMDITKLCAARISSRISDIYKHSDIKEIYTRAVGRKNIEAKKSLEDRHLHDFGFTIGVIPSEPEIREFKESLTLALQEQSIFVEDKIQAEAIAKRNIKQALVYLAFKRRKNLKRTREENLENIQVQSQANAQAAAAAEQAKVQAYQSQAEIDVRKEQSLSLIRVREQMAMNQVNQPVQQREFQFEIYKEQLKQQTALEKEEMKESEKNRRQDRNNAQQSQMIEQRRADSPPIDFEQDEEFSEFFQS